MEKVIQSLIESINPLETRETFHREFSSYSSEYNHVIAEFVSEKHEISRQFELMKAGAIESIIEKERIIIDLTNKLEKSEAKTALYEENQEDFEKERENLQMRIIDLANMLDKEAEFNELKRRNIEIEVSERVNKQISEEIKKFANYKEQMIQTIHHADEKIRKLEENEEKITHKLVYVEEKAARELEVFKKSIDNKSNQENFKLEIEKIVHKYEKQMADLLKEFEKKEVINPI